MKIKYIIIIFILFTSCKKDNTALEKSIVLPEQNKLISISKKQFEAKNMKLDSISKQSFYTTVNATGVIDVPPENKAVISSFMGGFVTKNQLLIGDKVNKGQLVATLQNTAFVELQQEYLEIVEKLQFLKVEYERQEKLYKELITSKKNYLKAESNYKSNLAIYKGLYKKLQMLNINPKAVEEGKITSTINLFSPINGYVTKINASNGSFISSENALLEIINTDHIHLELNIFENDILKIKKDQKIKFKIPEASSRTFNAEVYLVGTFIDENRTVKIHGHIENDEKTNFISGMFIEAEIITNEINKSALPKSAIIKSDEQNQILVFKKIENENYIFDEIEIVTGLENEKFIEVKTPELLFGKKVLSKTTTND
jgi:cobalt-zinc-cadmium efflux system membrane fusion protein